VDVVVAGSGTFLSRDPEKHWPNFATIVVSDEYDRYSDLDRPGVYRLSIGIGPATFKRLFPEETEHDFRALDQLTPHPEYATQRWVAILGPSPETFEGLVMPLLDEAYRKLAPRSQAAGPAADPEAPEA
jgi:hypothetical protein